MEVCSAIPKCVIGGALLTREEAIHKYLHLVRYVAGRISKKTPPQVDMDDLVNEGILGLIDAICKYDDARGIKFETYAITRINGAILDALREMDWVPRAVRKKARDVEKAFADLEASLGRVPGDGEVATALGLTVKEYHTFLVKLRGTSILSLEEFIPSERGYGVSLLDHLGDTGPGPTHALETSEVKTGLAAAVDALPLQERTVISLHYFEDLTLKEIKAVLDVSESRVSQIHAQAVIRLRVKLKALHIDLGHREGDPNVKQKYMRKGPARRIAPANIQRTVLQSTAV
ncbi:MAG: FliA/WhiG family RNA polymerase sigma factor [Candidatus Eremiobacteraeota bacterium]|nr:FliA/WhiG family RNA polymerase sigma factor [Candidatus Eremiobacteraeota bacterium]